MLKKYGFGASPGLQTLFLIFLLVVVIVLSTGMGYIKISPTQVIEVVFARITGISNLLKGIDSVFPYVIIDVRLPRILTSAIVGAGLSIAGVIFQGILLLGIYSVPLFAFLGAVATLFAVMFLSSSDGQTSSNNLILSGIIVAAILSAGISFIKYVADEQVSYVADEQVSIIIFWLMGSFGSKTWTDVFLTFFCVSTGFLICLFFARDLNIISLGDRSANSLGIETNRVRMTLLVTASLITAVCVSVSGIIGFVGLIIPHLMRFFVGPDNNRLIPASALVGATLLLCADTITRAVLPTEVPIGVLTALIGGPFFCYIFKKRRIIKTYG